MTSWEELNYGCDCRHCKCKYRDNLHTHVEYLQPIKVPPHVLRTLRRLLKHRGSLAEEMWFIRSCNDDEDIFPSVFLREPKHILHYICNTAMFPDVLFQYVLRKYDEIRQKAFDYTEIEPEYDYDTNDNPQFAFSDNEDDAVRDNACVYGKNHRILDIFKAAEISDYDPDTESEHMFGFHFRSAEGSFVNVSLEECFESAFDHASWQTHRYGTYRDLLCQLVFKPHDEDHDYDDFSDAKMYLSAFPTVINFHYIDMSDNAERDEILDELILKEAKEKVKYKSPPCDYEMLIHSDELPNLCPIHKARILDEPRVLDLCERYYDVEFAQEEIADLCDTFGMKPIGQPGFYTIPRAEYTDYEITELDVYYGELEWLEKK